MSLFALILYSGFVAGTITTRISHEPLRAHVNIVNTEQIFFCDSSGRFVSEELDFGRYQILISHIGFKEETLSVTVPATDTLFLNIYLTEVPIMIEPIDVITEKEVHIGTRTMDQAEIQTIPGAERDVFRAVQTLAGVSTASDYLGYLYVRGGELYENQVLFDDIEILAPYHYFGIGSVFNVDMIRDFTFHMGTFPARYGGAISSVLNIQSKEPQRVFGGAANIDLIETDVFLNSRPFSNLSLTASVKRNYLDFLLKNLGITESVLLPFFLDLQAKITLESILGDFSLSGLKSKEKTDLTAVFSGEEVTLNIDGKSNTAGVGWHRAFGKLIECNATMFYGDRRLDFYGAIPRYGDDPEAATEELFVKKYGGQFQTRFLTDIIGFEIGGGAGNYALRHAGARIEDVFYTIGILNYELDYDSSDNYEYVYASQRFSGIKPFVLEIGGRIDWFPTIEKAAISPRARLAYNGKPTVYVSFGHQHQLPPLEFDLIAPKSSYAECINFGIEHFVVPSLLGRLELYDKRYHNLVTTVGEDLYDAVGEGRAYGIELSLRKYETDGYFGWISYGFSFSERVTPYDATPAMTDVQRPHIFNTIFGAKLAYGIEISMKFQLSSGVPYRPVIGTKLVPHEDSWAWRPVYAPEKTRLPYYNRLDFRLAKAVSVWGLQGEVYLAMLNTTNHKNLQGYLYNSDFTERKPIYMLPRIPYIGFQLRF